VRTVAAFLAIAVAAGLAAAAPRPAPEFAIIAHRGASGVLPEHTLEAYAHAIDQGADFVEPDLVMTRDGHLVARHERQLGRSTDVSRRPEFAARRTVKRGSPEADWYVEDFTLAELRTLRARQVFPGRSARHDDRLGVASLDDILSLVRGRAAALGRPVGVWIELKHPSEFAAMGLDPVGPLLRALTAGGFGPGGLPAVVQSFDAAALRRVDAVSRVPLVLLAAGAPPLEAAADFADGVGVAKHLLIDRHGRPTGLAARARALGLRVYAWTFRDDAVAPAFASPEDELRAHLALGLDGVITDFTDTAAALRGSL
jgi:glycerophosphoryl diester phosphodiesterase